MLSSSKCLVKWVIYALNPNCSFHWHLYWDLGRINLSVSVVQSGSPSIKMRPLQLILQCKCWSLNDILLAHCCLAKQMKQMHVALLIDWLIDWLIDCERFSVYQSHNVRVLGGHQKNWSICEGIPLKFMNDKGARICHGLNYCLFSPGEAQDERSFSHLCRPPLVCFRFSN